MQCALHTASGKRYVADMDMDVLREQEGDQPPLGLCLLETVGGTLVNLAHVEAIEPLP